MSLSGGVRPADRGRGLGRRVALPLLVFLASSLLYLVNLDRAPHPDELYHVLAARGLLEHGEPRLAEGLYTRVFAYTWLIAQLFAGLGESLSVARLPSVLAMAALNTLLFAWLRREAGLLAAALATGLLALSPFAVSTAQFARFYGLQSLFFLAGCLAAYEAARRPWPIGWRVLGQAVSAAACLAFAAYLQPTTLLGVVGLGLWLVTAIGVPWLAAGAAPRRHKHLAVGLLLAAGALLGGVLLATGLAAELVTRYRWTPGFLAPQADEFWFYHLFYVLYYPSLWPVIGLLCLAGLAVRPRLAWFAMVVFATGFLLNSFAGSKNLRYLAYAQPFLFILFGLGLATILPGLARAGRTFKQQLDGHLGGIGLAGRRLPDILVWGAVLVVLVANAASLRTVAELADIAVPPLTPTAQWPQARPVVQPLLDEAEVVVTMAELPTLYFWERYDLLFSPSRLTELPERHEFVVDFRTGRPVIGTLDSLARVVACTTRGVFVGPLDRWREARFIDAATAAFIERELVRLDLPRAMRLVVFTWDHAPDSAATPACDAVRELLAETGE